MWQKKSGTKLAYRHALGSRIATSLLVHTDLSELGLKTFGLPNHALFVSQLPGKEGKTGNELAFQDCSFVSLQSKHNKQSLTPWCPE